MTENLTIVEIDCSTGASITRNMTADEARVHTEKLAEIEEQQAAQAAAEEAKAAAAASAADKLAKLGLTEEEIAALRG